MPVPEATSAGVATARDYYDSEEADNFYATIWGGEDIHVGIYEESRDIREASRATVDRMAKHLGSIEGKHVLDLGAGFGGAARVLAREYGARVTCLNLSRVENERNRQLTREAGLGDRIAIIDGSFDAMPFDEVQFDIAWSQDAILHAPDRRAVLDEIARVLAPGGGELIFAYFSFRKNEARTIRSALRPLIGGAVDRLPGKAIDVVAIVATVFGVATSLGFGAAQINAGLEQLFGFEISITHRLLIVAGITAVAVFSVASGLKRGIKILSLTNIWLAALILAVTLAFAPLEPILRNLTLRVGDYLWSLPSLTLATASDNSGWSAAWTTFYWGWWISWTPFVGLFIARISRGRTIREFVCGVLLIPTIVTFVWLSIMGGAAFSVARAEPDIIALAQQSPGLSLYTMIEAIQPGSIATAVAAIATILVALFFVTSADSGTLVVTTLQAGGDTDPPLAERVQWGIAIGAVAAALLLAGGLGALQAIAIAAALPFSVVLVAMIAGLFVALRKDRPPPA
jgi:SAM-dependent methyltransferase